MIGGAGEAKWTRQPSVVEAERYRSKMRVTTVQGRVGVKKK